MMWFKVAYEAKLACVKAIIVKFWLHIGIALAKLYNMKLLMQDFDCTNEFLE